MTTFLLLFIACGAALIAMSVPLVLGRVPPNQLYGFRVRRTLAQPEIWYPANRYSGQLGAALGLILIVAAVGLYCVPGIGLEMFAWSFLAVTGVGLALLLGLSFRYLRSLPTPDPKA
jgi:hypothetical protein